MGAQVRVELTGELAVLLGVKRQRPVRRGQLLAERVVRVDDSPAHLGDGLAVAHPPRVQHDVDRKVDRLQRREQQLRRPREHRLLGQRAQRQQRLEGAALRRVDHQAAVLLEDRGVGVAHQVGLQRLVRRPSVRRLDHQRARRPVRVDDRLADTAARRAAQQPLKLTRRRPPHRQRPARALIGAFLGGDQRLQLGAGDRRHATNPERVLQPPARAIHAAHQAGAQPRGALGLQRDRHVHLRDERAQLAQMRLVACQVRAPRRRILVACVEHPSRLLDVPVGRVGASDPPQREVRLDREREARQPPEPLALVRGGHERIRHARHPIQRRPRVPVPDEDVLVHEPQRKATHRPTSRT